MGYKLTQTGAQVQQDLNKIEALPDNATLQATFNTYQKKVTGEVDVQIGDGLAFNETTGKLSVDTTEIVAKDDVVKINGYDLVKSGGGQITIKTYQDFPSTWTTEGTLEEVVNSILSDSTYAKVGQAYLGQISGEATPFGYGDVECIVTFMTDDVAFLQTSSSNIEPYYWIYNTASGDYKWLEGRGSGSASNKVLTLSTSTTPYAIKDSDGNTLTYKDILSLIADKTISTTVIVDGTINCRPTTYDGIAIEFTNNYQRDSKLYLDRVIINSSDEVLWQEVQGALVIEGTAAPTTSTVGYVGQHYINTTDGTEYECTKIDATTYTWVKLLKEGDVSGVEIEFMED